MKLFRSFTVKGCGHGPEPGKVTTSILFTFDSLSCEIFGNSDLRMSMRPLDGLFETANRRKFKSGLKKFHFQWVPLVNASGRFYSITAKYS